MPITILPARTDQEILDCFLVLSQLRPALERDQLVAQVRRMEAHGFRLVRAVEDGMVRAVAGYRITEMLRTGLMMEVDDLVTEGAARSGGYGRALFDWLLEEARAQGCSVLELDSGVQRHEAHRFYHRQRMHVLGYHFSITCGEGTSAAMARQLAGLPAE
jgi:GNAT superfamily N-acetyltransferase